MEHLEPVKDTKELMASVYNVSIDSIQMALALTVALAWYAFVKGGINKVWPDHGDKLWALGAFAILITVIFAVVLFIVKNVLKINSAPRPVVYAVAPSMM